MAEAFSVVKLRDPKLGLGEVQFLPRGSDLRSLTDPARTVLAIANPHALHAPTILAAEQAGLAGVVVEKPAVVSLSAAGALEAVKIPAVVCHGYRMMWGPETLRDLVASGELGSLVSIEGRYWQSSAAQKKTNSGEWKNDPKLSGPFDVLLDLATHWLDLVTLVAGSPATRVQTRRFYANAAADHRDTHVHVFADGREWSSLGSVSKTIHGAGNDLELNLIGTSARVSWSFSEPDRIALGKGRDVQWLARSGGVPRSSGHAPFHALGWLEGYVEAMHRFFSERNGQEFKAYPTLPESLMLTSQLIRAAEREKI